MNPWTPIIAATIGWGSSAVITRAIILRGVDTYDLLPARMTFAMLSLGVVILFDRTFGTTDSVAWKRGTVLGVVSMALPMATMTLGVEDLPVSLGGLLIALVPIATIAAAHFLVEGERFVARSLPGLLISLVGSAVLVGIGGGTIEGVGNLWRGVGLTVFGVVLAGIGGALSRRYAMEVTSKQLVLPQFAVATVILFAISPFLGEAGPGSFDQTEWILLALSGIVGTTLPFGAFLVAASMNPASRLGMTGYTVPVVAVALAVLLLGESVTVSIVLGAILILSGVYLAERGTKHIPEPGVSTSR